MCDIILLIFKKNHMFCPFVTFPQITGFRMVSGITGRSGLQSVSCVSDLRRVIGMAAFEVVIKSLSPFSFVLS